MGQTADNLAFLSASFVVEQWIQGGGGGGGGGRACNLPTFPGTHQVVYAHDAEWNVSHSLLLPRSMTDYDTRHGHGSVEVARKGRGG